VNDLRLSLFVGSCLTLLSLFGRLGRIWSKIELVGGFMSRYNRIFFT
jgi:hypothetical protein